MTEHQLEALLKKAFHRGELNSDLSDEDIEYLLAHCEMAKPSKNLAKELEQILLGGIRERESVALPAEPLVGQEMFVMEKSEPYALRGADEPHCSVGDALRETMHANAWNEEQAARKLGVSHQIIQDLINETVRLTRKTARSVSDYLSNKYRLPTATQELLTQWLLNGLHFWSYKTGPAGSMRMAARKKKE